LVVDLPSRNRIFKEKYFDFPIMKVLQSKIEFSSLKRGEKWDFGI